MAVVRKVGGVLGTVISVLLVLAIAATITLAIAQRRSGQGIPVILHHEVLTLLSGSMAPVLRTGDIVVDSTVTQAQAAHLHVGQIVTYELTGRTFQGKPMLITHRIVGIMTVTSKQTGKAGRLYFTKGDANNAIDPAPVAPSQIVGLYRWRIPYGGYVSAFIHRPIGFALFIGLPVLYLIGGEFLRLWRGIDDQERREREAHAAQSTSLPADSTRAPLA